MLLTIGALAAPFPFIFGIHSSTYQSNQSYMTSDIVRVFLDENRIEFGNLGLPPPLPERRYRKLVNSLKELIPELRSQKMKGMRQNIGKP